jgi:Tol biopolymer transport system component
LVALTGLAIWAMIPGKWPRVASSTRLTYSGQATGPLGLFWKEFPAIVTDGNRIYVTTWRNGPELVAYIPTAGGDLAFVQTPVQGRLCHISPDGSMLLVFGTIPDDRVRHLWFVSTAGGVPRRLGEIDGMDGAWSPDGQEIAYSKNKALYVAHSDGSGSRKLATIDGTAQWLRWSPDGKRIRFTLVDAKTGITSLWECGSDGGNLRRVVNNSGERRAECCGEWSADGRFFFFRTLDKNHSEFWEMREKGFGLREAPPRVLTTGPLDFAAAAPSKDTRELYAIETQPRARLLRYDVMSKRLEPYLSDAHMASNSRDGKWIAYVEVRGPETILWRSRTDGSEKLPLTTAMKAIAWPKWSPNGKQIAFAAEDTGKPSMAYVVDAAGGAPQAVSPADHLYADPNWSPDGKTLMVGRLPEYMAERGARKGIEMVNLETKKVTELEGSEGMFSPHWSPDGRFVATSKLDQHTLMLYDFSTRKWRERVSGTPDKKVWIDSAQWSPDSRYIYYNDPNQAAVMRVSKGTEDPTPVLNLKAVDPNASYCAFVETTWDGALTINCWFDGGDIYRLKLEMR